MTNMLIYDHLMPGGTENMADDPGQFAHKLSWIFPQFLQNFYRQPWGFYDQEVDLSKKENRLKPLLVKGFMSLRGNRL